MQISSSRWLKELYEKREQVEGTNWRDYDFREYKHYIIESNKNWIEVIASNVEFRKVLSKKHMEIVRFFREI